MAQKFKCFIFGIYQLNILAVGFSQNYPGDKCNDKTGRNSICRLFSECPAAQNDLKKGIQPVNCGFQNSNPVVCCPDTIGTTTPVPSRKAGEAAKYWCDQYIEHCPERYEISIGEKALPNEFPHMAGIGYGEKNRIMWGCGGTLISEKFVLTAAHCLHSGHTGPARWVLLATEILPEANPSEGRKGQTHPVTRRIRHPEYKPPSKYHDVALLELGPAITPNALPTGGKYLHPACLPTRDFTYNNLLAIATGWGRVGHGEDGSPELLKVELQIYEESKCNQTFEVEIKTTNWLRKGIDTTMLCAGAQNNSGKDTCKGDSGGPLQVSLRSDCLYEVWGITSFGKICGFPNSPAVYMRVSEYIPWIERIVWPMKP